MHMTAAEKLPSVLGIVVSQAREVVGAHAEDVLGARLQLATGLEWLDELLQEAAPEVVIVPLSLIRLASKFEPPMEELPDEGDLADPKCRKIVQRF